VINWKAYQADETQMKLKRNSSETQVKTNNNDNNTNNDNNINEEVAIAPIEEKKSSKGKPKEHPLYRGFIKRFNEIKGGRYMGNDIKTIRQFTKLIESGINVDEMIEALRNAKNDSFLSQKPQYLTPEYITRSDKFDQWFNSGKENKVVESVNVVALRDVLKKYYPTMLSGITDNASIELIIKYCTKIDDSDYWMMDNWKDNVKLFLDGYASHTDEKFYVRSVDALVEKVKLWKEYQGKFN
jgi:hypothetical protein